MKNFTAPETFTLLLQIFVQSFFYIIPKTRTFVRYHALAQLERFIIKGELHAFLIHKTQHTEKKDGLWLKHWIGTQKYWFNSWLATDFLCDRGSVFHFHICKNGDNNTSFLRPFLHLIYLDYQFFRAGSVSIMSLYNAQHNGTLILVGASRCSCVILLLIIIQKDCPFVCKSP